MGVKTAGGTATGALRVVIVAHAVSLSVLLVILGVSHGVWPPHLPHGALLGWGLGAGVSAGVSLTAFYIALSRGAMGASAAVSGLLAAAIPAVVSRVIEGAPTPLRLAGFVLAAAAIWIIAAGPSPENAGEGGALTMALAVVGGLGFGFYFVALRMDNVLGVFEPMALARAGSLATCVVLLTGTLAWQGAGKKQTRSGNDNQNSQSNGEGGLGGWGLSRAAVGWALGVALLDTGGNMLFLVATRMGRLDVAAVLASLYPASTILLAAWMLHERPTRRQMTGMAIAVAAVVMITV
jgi:drug/metabolite transporter (DMT)-like permease